MQKTPLHSNAQEFLEIDAALRAEEARTLVIETESKAAIEKLSASLDCPSSVNQLQLERTRLSMCPHRLKQINGQKIENLRAAQKFAREVFQRDCKRASEALVDSERRRIDGFLEKTVAMNLDPSSKSRLAQEILVASRAYSAANHAASLLDSVDWSKDPFQRLAKAVVSFYDFLSEWVPQSS